MRRAPEDHPLIVDASAEFERARASVGGGVPFVFDGQAAAKTQAMLIKRIIPVAGICFIGGQSGAGKTFVAVNAVVCLASGCSFFGFPIRERIGVAILAAEGAGGLQRRIEAAKAFLGIERPLPIAWVSVTEN